nr:hypothetical protein CFP56_16923 [Quercus suber]
MHCVAFSAAIVACPGRPRRIWRYTTGHLGSRIRDEPLRILQTASRRSAQVEPLCNGTELMWSGHTLCRGRKCHSFTAMSHIILRLHLLHRGLSANTVVVASTQSWLFVVTFTESATRWLARPSMHILLQVAFNMILRIANRQSTTVDTTTQISRARKSSARTAADMLPLALSSRRSRFTDDE